LHKGYYFNWQTTHEKEMKGNHSSKKKDSDHFRMVPC